MHDEKKKNTEHKRQAKIIAYETKISTLDTFRLILTAIITAFALVIALAIREILEPWIVGFGTSETTAKLISILLYMIIAIIIGVILMHIEKMKKSQKMKAEKEGIIL